jgi:hypothetical protein
MSGAGNCLLQWNLALAKTRPSKNKQPHKHTPGLVGILRLSMQVIAWLVSWGLSSTERPASNGNGHRRFGVAPAKQRVLDGPLNRVVQSMVDSSALMGSKQEGCPTTLNPLGCLVPRRQHLKQNRYVHKLPPRGGDSPYYTVHQLWKKWKKSPPFCLLLANLLIQIALFGQEV